MGRIPDDIVDAVRQAADITDVIGRRVQLRKAGKTFKGVCPFHGDTDPSMVVNRERGTWHCFGCGEGGNVFSFVMRDQGLSFPEAVRQLADQYGIAVPEEQMTEKQRQEYDEKEKLLRVLQLAGTFFRQQLDGPRGDEARRYLYEKRALSRGTVEEFSLGYAPQGWEELRRHLLGQGVPEDLAIKSGLLVQSDKGRGSYDRFRDRVVFPIGDTRGRVVSFGGRIIGQGEPKYLNGSESPVFFKSGALYNIERARQAMHQKDRAIVVEGYFDVITLAAGGFAETVAPMGTALTSQQIKMLAGSAGRIILLFDGDEAGIRAARRSLPVFLGEDIFPLVHLLPRGEDPDSFLRAHGPEALDSALETARPLVQVSLDEIVQQGDSSTPEGKSNIVAQAGGIIKAIKDPVTSWGYLERLAGRLRVPVRLCASRLGMPMGGASPKAAPVRTVQKCEPLGGQGERAVLEAALASPEAARHLANCGLLESLRDPALAKVGRAVAAELDRSGNSDPASVIQHLDDPQLHSLVAGLAAKELKLNSENAVKQAELLADRLRAKRLRREKNMLQQAIAEAERAGDHQEVDRLHLQRQRLMDKQLPLSTEKG